MAGSHIADMSKETKLSVVKEIVGWNTNDEYLKLCCIQNYMLGWISEEEVHDMTKQYER